MKSIWDDLPEDARISIQQSRPDLAEVLRRQVYGKVVRICVRSPLTYRRRQFLLLLHEKVNQGICKSHAVEQAAEELGMSWRHAYRIAAMTDEV